MSELRTSLILTGDARGLISASQLGASSLQKLDGAVAGVGATSTQTATEVSKLAVQENTVQRATELGTTAIQQRINGLVRYNASTGSARQSANTFNTALAQGKVSFDGLRTSLDPVYRASRQYEAIVRQTQSAVTSGAASQAEANRVLALAEAQYLGTANAASTMGRNGNMAAGQLGNISAQFNDIGVMLAAGQNPLQLALQQGTQLNQVFAQMGGGRAALRGTVAALTSMINPVSLATIGIIAGGAALIQWATAADEADEAGEAFGEMLKAIGEQAKEAREEVDLFLGGFANAEVMAVTNRIEALRGEAVSLRDRASGQSGRNRRNTNLRADYADGEADELQQSLDLRARNVSEAENLKAIQEQIKETISATTGDLITQAKSRVDGMIAGQEMVTVLQEEFAIAQAIAAYGADSVEVAELRVGAARRLVVEQIESADQSRQMKEELIASWDAANGVASVDMAGNITLAANEASRMASELGRAVSNAVALANQGVGDVERARINYEFRDNPVGKAGALAGAEFDARARLPAGADSTIRNVVEKEKREFVGARVEAARYNQSLQDWRKAQTEAARSAKSGAGAAKSAGKKGLADQKRALKDEERVLKDIRSQMSRLAPGYERDTEELLKWREDTLAALNPARAGYAAFAQDVETIFGERLAEAYRDDLERRSDWAAGTERAFLDLSENMITWADTGENLVQKWSSGLEDAFVEMGQTGKFEVGSLVDYTLEQFQRLLFQQTIQPGIDAGFGFLTNALSGLFPSFGTAAGSTPLTQSHAGSTIGAGGVRRSYGPGSPLRADERLTVTTLGQRVFTPEQIGNGATVVDALAQAASSGSGGGGGMVFAPNIGIENRGSTPVQGEIEEQNDGNGGRNYKLVLADEVGAAMVRQGGGARKQLKAGGFRPKRTQR